MSMQLQGKTAVICEDESAMRRCLQKALDSAGVQVLSEATNGMEAIDQVLRDRPDLVLMDVQMPLLDGTEAVRRIREADPDYNPCVVMLTAHSEEAYRDASAEAGATAYFVKPFTPQPLLEQIELVYENHLAAA